MEPDLITPDCDTIYYIKLLCFRMLTLQSPSPQHILPLSVPNRMPTAATSTKRLMMRNNGKMLSAVSQPWLPGLWEIARQGRTITSNAFVVQPVQPATLKSSLAELTMFATICLTWSQPAGPVRSRPSATLSDFR